MGILSGVRNAFGMVKVTEQNGVITVDGINAAVLTKVFIAFTNNTTKVVNNIFLTKDKYSFSFYSFYAVEVNFLLLKAMDMLKSWSTTQTIRRIIDGLKENTWLKSTVNPPPPMVDLRFLQNLKWTPKPHQLEFIKVYGEMVPKYDLHGYLLSSKPGSGKTFADLAVAACVIPRSIAQVKIIISPKNAVDLVWDATVKEVFKRVPTSWSSTTPGPAPYGKEYYIFHYEAMDRALELAQQLLQTGVRYFVIVDESHNFNVLTSQRTQNLIQLCNMTPWPTYSIWASGTPVKAMGTEIMSILAAIDRKFTPQVASSFKRAFNTDKRGAMEIVAHRFGVITYKAPDVQTVKNEPIIKDIKVKIPDPSPFTMDAIRLEMRAFHEQQIQFYKSNMSAYRAIFEECVQEHRMTLKTVEQKKMFNQWVDSVSAIRSSSAQGGMPDPAIAHWAKVYETEVLIPSLAPESAKRFLQVRTIVKTLRQKVQGEALGLLGKRRSECITQIALHADILPIIGDAEGKTMIFSTYVNPVEAVSQRLEKAGLTPIRIFGPTASDVTARVAEFTKNPEINPITTTYMSLSTAVPVIAANTEIMLDFPFRDYIFQQAVARVSRMGQTRQCYIYCLVLDTGTKENISSRSQDIMEWSKEISQIIMGDEMDVDLSKMSFSLN